MTVAILSISDLQKMSELSRLSDFASCLTVLTRNVRGQYGHVSLLKVIACLKLTLE